MKLLILITCGFLISSVATAQDAVDKNHPEQSKTPSLSDPNGPLFVVDGLIQKDPIGNRKLNPFINPDSIEKVEVFKDKTAIALYGEAGRNGVVVITTKEFSKKSQIPKE